MVQTMSLNDTDYASTEYSCISSLKLNSPKLKPKRFLLSPSHKLNCMCNCSDTNISLNSPRTPQCANKAIHSSQLDKEIIITKEKNYKEANYPPILEENLNCVNTEVDVNKSKFNKTIQKQFGDLIFLIKNSIEKSEVRLLESERREVIQNEWSDVAMILDRVLCCLFLILTIASCAIIFLSSPHTLASW